MSNNNAFSSPKSSSSPRAIELDAELTTETVVKESVIRKNNDGGNVCVNWTEETHTKAEDVSGSNDDNNDDDDDDDGNITDNNEWYVFDTPTINVDTNHGTEQRSVKNKDVDDDDVKRQDVMQLDCGWECWTAWEPWEPLLPLPLPLPKQEDKQDDKKEDKEENGDNRYTNSYCSCGNVMYMSQDRNEPLPSSSPNTQRMQRSEFNDTHFFQQSQHQNQNQNQNSNNNNLDRCRSSYRDGGHESGTRPLNANTLFYTPSLGNFIYPTPFGDNNQNANDKQKATYMSGDTQTNNFIDSTLFVYDNDDIFSEFSDVEDGNNAFFQYTHYHNNNNNRQNNFYSGFGCNNDDGMIGCAPLLRQQQHSDTNLTYSSPSSSSSSSSRSSALLSAFDALIDQVNGYIQELDDILTLLSETLHHHPPNNQHNVVDTTTTNTNRTRINNSNNNSEDDNDVLSLLEEGFLNTCANEITANNNNQNFWFLDETTATPSSSYSSHWTQRPPLPPRYYNNDAAYTPPSTPSFATFFGDTDEIYRNTNVNSNDENNSNRRAQSLLRDNIISLYENDSNNNNPTININTSSSSQHPSLFASSYSHSYRPLIHVPSLNDNNSDIYYDYSYDNNFANTYASDNQQLFETAMSELLDTNDNDNEAFTLPPLYDDGLPTRPALEDVSSLVPLITFQQYFEQNLHKNNIKTEDKDTKTEGNKDTKTEGNKDTEKDDFDREKDNLDTEKDDLDTEKDDKVTEKHGYVCAICLEEFDMQASTHQLLRQPQCQHIFHKECFDPWVLCSHTCPMCRADFF